MAARLQLLYRGYYIAARGYEFYLRVLKVSLTGERSERVRDTFSTRRSVYYIDTDEIPHKRQLFLFVFEIAKSAHRI